ncbi:protein phloem protein 2-like a9 [Phtheirospermum japonicum]|uniref:Protein phloem protein 2-like a9 n=1 Tax=Phtheirospermum japonicum TaxID=374723 RepID=A0A830D4Q6_9LAMI|nr:protein phloem protein 2-like a9 [Phtheirospermum japonicum]
MASNASPHHLPNPSTKFIKDKQGKMIYQPKDLNIVWGEDDHYWNVPNKENSAAKLRQISWLEVTGSIDGTSRNKNYDVGFRLSLAPDAFGWGTSPIYVMVKRGKEGKFAWEKVFLNPKETSEFEVTGRLMKADKQKARNSDDDKVYFGLYEVWSGKWKGAGLSHNEAAGPNNEGSTSNNASEGDNTNPKPNQSTKQVSLPHNYEDILKHADSPVDRSSTEKLLEQLYAETTYEIAFILKLKDPAYGWQVPVNLRLTLPDGTKQERKENLMEKPREKWIEISAGEFKSSAEKVGEIEISLFEYEGGIWKKGLLIKGIVIRPKAPAV